MGQRADPYVQQERLGNLGNLGNDLASPFGRGHTLGDVVGAVTNGRGYSTPGLAGY